MLRLLTSSCSYTLHTLSVLQQHSRNLQDPIKTENKFGRGPGHYEVPGQAVQLGNETTRDDLQLVASETVKYEKLAQMFVFFVFFCQYFLM